MWTETETFDVDEATKNDQKILDLGPTRGRGWILIRSSINYTILRWKRNMCTVPNYLFRAENVMFR